MNINKNFNSPEFKRKIIIKGNVLFLMGPIGTFFVRLSNYLKKRKVKIFKIIFPLHEFGYKRKDIVCFSGDIKEFKLFVKQLIIKNRIKHVFMYGNVLIPHKDTLLVCAELKKEGYQIESHIFELGYLRPNYVTIEDRGVNYESDFIRNINFYENQIGYKHYPIARKNGLRIRKYWKVITFIQHSLKNYKIVDINHKLQPKPIFLWFQLKGLILKFFYRLTEFNLKKKLLNNKKFFMVILQVSYDSQITCGSEFKDNKKFIEFVIENFSKSELKDINIIFKHHPRDRGYNNYAHLINKLSEKLNLKKQVFYIHDYPLSKIFMNGNCKGTVLINSTVGYQSLFHSVPVKAFGKSAYNMERLTDQNDLISFFKSPKKVDEDLFNKFYKYILENSQINGNFDGYFPFDEIFTFK